MLWEPLNIHFGGQANLFDSGQCQKKVALASAKPRFSSLPEYKNILLAAQKQFLELPLAFFRRLFGRNSGFSGLGESREDMSDVMMIVGLGNPGSRYDGTRHNVGFSVVDRLASRLGVDVKKKKFGGFFCESVFEGKKVLLLKPQQYMNCSGQVVVTAKGFYRCEIDKLIVVTDDMALEPGRIRIRSKGSAGGHNGLSDIIGKLGSNEFGRLRVGIGRSEVIAAKDYVLGRPTSDERGAIEKAIEAAEQGLLCWIREGIDVAMNRFNG